MVDQEHGYSKLNSKVKLLWRLDRLGGLVLLTGMLALLLWLHNLYQPVFPQAWLAWLTASVLVFIQLLNVFIRPLIQYRQWAYLLTADRIEIKKGIFFHTTQIVPISRIQHVTVGEGPMQRLFGLASITIMTAGSSMSIDGLALSTANDLCEYLKSAVNRKVFNQQGQTAENIYGSEA